MKLHKRLRLFVGLALVGIVALCCAYPSALFLFDNVLYPLWLDSITPHPTSITLPQPQLLVAGLPQGAEEIYWANDGTSIVILGHNYKIDNPHPDRFMIKADAHTGTITEKQTVDYYSDFGTKDLPSRMPIPLEDEHSIWGICPTQDRRVIGHELGRNKWEVELWQGEKLIATFSLSSNQWQDEQYPPTPGRFSFSPDCERFALTLSGWVYYEGDGQEELWILDIPSQTLKQVLTGRWASYRLWDYPVQILSPSWSPNGDELVFGDGQFGLEIFDVSTEKRRWLAGPSNSGYLPRWSPTGLWIVAERHESPQASVILLSADGKHMSTAGGCGFMISDKAWAPADDRLAYLCSENSTSDQKNLWVWIISEEPGN